MAGPSVYAASKRGRFLGRLPGPAQPLADLLYEELDGLEEDALDDGRIGEEGQDPHVSATTRAQEWQHRPA
ncbi:MAG TPA: hypothetical protein VE173_11655 [Longimicrobiales bacterium]|nr:hypothetical protein [Longimicrobiales bacterium]